jgi:protein SCO1/2
MRTAGLRAPSAAAAAVAFAVAIAVDPLAAAAARAAEATAPAPDAARAAPALKAGVFEPPRDAPAFSLRGSDGAELTLARFRGKVVIVEFGFTACPDVCPTTLATLAGARKQLGADAEGLQVVYVTVDPERDDVARLRTYLAAFDPTFVGGTGTAAELEAVRKEYGIAATRLATPEGYGFSHSSYTYLIDRHGKLRALMPYGHSSEDYAHDVRILLAQ